MAKKTLPPIRSKAELAAQLGRDPGQVSRYIRRADWPFGSGPWARSEVPKILAWMADTLERQAEREDAKPGGAGDETKELRKQKLREEVRKLRANANQAETALARERGQLHDADECEREAVRRLSLVRNGMQNVPSQVIALALSHGLPHGAAPAFREQIDELVNGCLRHLATAADAEPESGDAEGPAGALPA